MVKARMDHLQGRKSARQAKHWRLSPWTSLLRMHSKAIIDFTFDFSIFECAISPLLFSSF